VSSVLAVCLLGQLNGQTTAEQLRTDQLVEKTIPSVALVLVGGGPGTSLATVGTGVVVRERGVLLTANHLIKNASAVQVRFKTGEVFDDVQLLGVDERRDAAAIRITASGLPVLPVSSADQAKPGDNVTVISNAAALPWSASTGIVAAYRLADEIPGAGSGYRLFQFTAPASPGSSGGVLIDGRGRALGLIVSSLSAAQNVNFAVPIESVLGLADKPVSKTFENGSALNPPSAVAAAARVTKPQQESSNAALDVPEKSEVLKSSKDRDAILRTFKTMFVKADRATYFGSDQLKAALGRNKDFKLLNIRVVDDPKLADVVLDVGYTFAWDYPFELRHQNTTTVLLAGKGSGPFSGPAGAASVANAFVKLAKPYRTSAGY
jgi:hypothetical protein